MSVTIRSTSSLNKAGGPKTSVVDTGGRPPEQFEQQRDGHQTYWESFWDAEQVFYGHVLGFKGLERRCVVLMVNDSNTFERSRERL